MGAVNRRVPQMSSRFQSRSFLPVLAESAQWPVGPRKTELIGSVCPLRVRMQRPVATSHSRSVLSRLPESAQRPSRLKQTDVTGPVCPRNVRTSSPVSAACSSNEN